MMTLRAKELLQSIIGPREVRDLIAMKQTGPVALCHFAEVREHGSQSGTAQLLVTRHGPQQGPQVALDASTIELLGISEYLGCPFDPAVGRTDQGPELSGVGEPLR
jgi:hypothetical protein